MQDQRVHRRAKALSRLYSVSGTQKCLSSKPTPSEYNSVSLWRTVASRDVHTMLRKGPCTQNKLFRSQILSFEWLFVPDALVCAYFGRLRATVHFRMQAWDAKAPLASTEPKVAADRHWGPMCEEFLIDFERQG